MDPADDDGCRVLVDRLWPRGLTHDRAHLDEWLRDVAPSTALRRWFAHSPSRWDEFRRRYRRELERNPALEDLSRISDGCDLTLLFASSDEEHNNAMVLKTVLEERRSSS